MANNNTTKTVTINAETHPCLCNLLTIPYITDTIIVEDLDAGGTINITELIEMVREELGL